jgi:signal transduction histidine kinase
VVSEVQAENPSSVIDCQTDGDLKGDWDPHPLKQVVANLLINAIQHGTGDPVRLMIKSDDRFRRTRIAQSSPPISFEGVISPQNVRCPI